MTQTVVFRCDASPTIGFGHAVRCIALANELCSEHGWQVVFAMVQGAEGVAIVGEQGHRVRVLSNTVALCGSEGRWLQQVVTEEGADVLVLDVRSDLAPAAVQAVRNQGVLIVTLDDPSDRRLVADLAFYPPVPQVQRMEWAGFTGELLVGWEWIVLRPEFARYRKAVNNHARTVPSHTTDSAKSADPTVLVTMGGSDPAGLTIKALCALDLLDVDFTTVVVLGPCFMHNLALETWLARAERSYELIRNAREMANIMEQADLAIASFGTTAYELAAMRVPAIYFCLSQDHAESAAALADLGVAISLGTHELTKSHAVAAVLLDLLTDSKRRLGMAQRGFPAIDGRGTQRIAEMIIQNARSTHGASH